MNTKQYHLTDTTRQNKTIGLIISNGTELGLINYNGCTNELLDVRHLLMSKEKFSNYGFKLKLVKQLNK